MNEVAIMVEREGDFRGTFKEWHAHALELGDRIERSFEWSELIKLTVRLATGGGHQLTLKMWGRGQQYGVSVCLNRWAEMSHDSHYILAAFNTLVSGAMFGAT